jgi:hypothetical protein
VKGTKTHSGGLVGWNEGSISCSYSTGKVKGKVRVGGLVGDNYREPVDRSYWDVQTSGQPDDEVPIILYPNAGRRIGAGRTTSEMKSLKTFEGWGRTFQWTLNEGHDYPRLDWESRRGKLIM